MQLAFDWNNAQLQANAAGLTFIFTSSSSTSWDCAKEGKKQKLTQTRTRTTSIVASIAYDARKNKVGFITGFNLNGISGSTEESEGPPLYSCPGGGGWTFVEGSAVTTDGDGERLLVCFDGDCRELSITE